MKRLFLLFNLIIILVILCSCSIYDKEYVSIEEYKYTSNLTSKDGNKLVSNIDELKEAVLSIVYSGENNGIVDFSENYIGKPEDDLKNVCWQVKSRDALCVYCVNNISYSLSNFVTYYEANIIIKYEETAIPLKDIHKLQYSTGIEDIVSTSIFNMDKRLGLLINRSTYSINDVETLIRNTYFNNPLISPVYPDVSINLFTGNESQRLYEVNFDYKVSSEELIEQKNQLADISLFSDNDQKLDDLEKSNLIINRLSKVNVVSDKCSVFDALVNNYSDSFGLALAYKALANSLDLESYVVNGLRFGTEYYWNIVKIEDNYYHIVIGDNSLIYVSDEVMWSTYRWNIADYPSCHNTLEYKVLINNESEIVSDQEELVFKEDDYNDYDDNS